MKDILTIIVRLTVSCILAATVMGSAFIVTNKAKKHNEHVNEQQVRYALLGYSAEKPIPESMALHEVYRYILSDRESQSIGYLLPEAWIREWLGGNSLSANFLATVIGAVSYFATMTEAPFVDTLMGLGMGKGPALTLLLTGPGLSLPNWLAIARVFGIRQALVYVPTIIVLGTLIGWLFGNFIL